MKEAYEILSDAQQRHLYDFILAKRLLPLATPDKAAEFARVARYAFDHRVPLPYHRRVGMAGGSTSDGGSPHRLAAARPALMAELAAAWQRWAVAVGVHPFWQEAQQREQQRRRTYLLHSCIA